MWVWTAIACALLALTGHVSALVDYDRVYDNSDSYLATSLDFPTPTLSRVDPPSGPWIGGQTITIWGADFYFSRLLRCRFAEKESWEGNVWETDATYISQSKITCLTPNFRPSDGDNGGVSSICLTTLTASGASCGEIYISVSNDRSAYSGYLASGSGSFLQYTIWRGPPMYIASPTTTSYAIAGQNSTVTLGGHTELNVACTRESSSVVPVRESQYLYCKFVVPSLALVDFTPATYVSASSELVDNIWCRVPESFSSEENSGNDPSYAGTVRLVYSLDSGVSEDEEAETTAAMTFMNARHTNNIPYDIVMRTRSDLAQSLQRAPMWGNAEVTMKGRNMYPSSNAKCAFVYAVSSTWRTAEELCDTANGWSLCSSGACCIVTIASFNEWSGDDKPDDYFPGYYTCMSPRHEYETEITYTYAPSIETDVLLALDDFDGMQIGKTLSADTYSIADAANTSLRISDIHVSPSGSDKDIDSTGGGDGTPQRPYRTVQRALDRALYNSRHPEDYENGPWGLQHGQPGASGSDQQFNRDLIILKQGVYRGPGNVGLRPRGKLVTLRSEWRNTQYPAAAGRTGNAGSPFVNGMNVVVDCQNSGMGFIDERGQRYWDNDDNTERESIYVEGIAKKNCLNKRVYSVYDWQNERNTFHRHPMVAYHAPRDGYLRNKRSIHPYSNRFRPGWNGEPSSNEDPTGA